MLSRGGGGPGGGTPPVPALTPRRPAAREGAAGHGLARRDDEVRALGPDDDGPHHVADARGRDPRSTTHSPSTSGAWCAARPVHSKSSSSAASTSTVTSVPTRSSARWAISSWVSAVIRSTRAAISSAGSLPS